MAVNSGDDSELEPVSGARGATTITAGEAAAVRAGVSDRFMILMLAAITSAGPVTLNMYVPALPAIQSAFRVSVAEAQTTLSVALVSFAIGILVYGPLSDRFGRRPIALWGLAIYVLGSTLCVLAPTLEFLVMGRVIQSLGAAAGLVVARATVGDLYPREKMARMIAFLTMVTVVGPTVSPILGGYLTAFWGWRSIFGFLLIVGCALFVLAWRQLPETRLTHAAGSSAGAIARATFALLRKPAFAAYLLQSGVIFSVFMAFISVMPYVMVDALQRPPTEYGAYYLLLAVGYFSGNWSVTRLSGRLGVQRLMLAGILLAAAAVLTAAAVVVLFDWWHPLAIFLPIMVMGVGQGMALPNITAAAVSLAPRNTGAASSLLGFSQQVVGAVSVQLMGLAATSTPYPLLGFCAAASLVALAAIRFLPSTGARLFET